MPNSRRSTSLFIESTQTKQTSPIISRIEDYEMPRNNSNVGWNPTIPSRPSAAAQARNAAASGTPAGAGNAWGPAGSSNSQHGLPPRPQWGQPPPQAGAQAPAAGSSLRRQVLITQTAPIGTPNSNFTPQTPNNGPSYASRAANIAASQQGYSYAGVAGAGQNNPTPHQGTVYAGPASNNPLPQPGPHGQQYMNPSVAPSPSMFTAAPSAAGSQAGSTFSTVTRSNRRPQPTYTPFCNLSNFKPNHYKVGDLYWVPYHEPNTDPSVQLGDDHLSQSMAGYVYSKKRMVVVLWTYADSMLCLPIYTFWGRGIASRPWWTQQEYVALVNHDDAAPQTQGRYDPVIAQSRSARKPIHPFSAIHITGGFKLACVVEHDYCGRLTEPGYTHLRDLWEQLCQDARNQTY